MSLLKQPCKYKQFKQLFNKVGGKEILRQYLQGHVLIYAFVMTILLGFSKKSLEIVRLAVGNKLLIRLRKQYKGFIANYLENADYSEVNKTFIQHSDIQDELSEAGKRVWVFWFQGMEHAPAIVQTCYHSLKENITDREIVLVTEENYKVYVQFPDFIIKKAEAGIISKTHFSDLLRLELLIKYGGTWVDATVLCTGTCPQYILNSDLFLFQNLKPGLNGACTCISSWFITAKADNKILKLTLALLYDYWKNNDKLVDYFLFHNFFQLAIETYPGEWSKVIPFSNSVPHILLLRFFDEYDESVWNAVKEMSTIHKLSYKFTEAEYRKEGTYYKKLIQR